MGLGDVHVAAEGAALRKSMRDATTLGRCDSAALAHHAEVERIRQHVSPACQSDPDRAAALLARRHNGPPTACPHRPGELRVGATPLALAAGLLGGKARARNVARCWTRDKRLDGVVLCQRPWRRRVLLQQR